MSFPDPAQRSADGPPGVPRWMKVVGLVVLVLVVLVVALLLLGGHGPSDHLSP